MAIGTPVVGAAAYSAQNGTSVAPAYPSGILATDVVLLFVGQKPSTANGGTATTPVGWTLRDELLAAGGYGTTLGADTGNTNLRIYSWDSPVAGQTGTRSVTLAVNNISWAFIVRIPKGGGTVSFGSADGQRTTAPTSPLSIALANGASATNFQSGDLAIWAMCIPTDVTTPSQFSAQSITATGATFGTAVELNEPDSATGNDIGGYSAYALVSSGSSTTAPTVQTNLAGTLTNVRGPVVLLRVREAAPTPDGTGAITLGGATVSGSGSPILAASGAVDLATAAVSGTVDVTPPGVDASGAVTLDTVVSAGSASQTHVATGAVTLADATATGTVAEVPFGTGTVTLDTVAVSGSASPVIVATGAVTLDTVTVSGSGSQTHVATGDVTLDTVAASGVVSDVVFGSGSITLDTVTVAGSGDVGASSVDGTGAVTLDAVTVAASGSPVVVSSGAIALDSVTSTGTVAAVVFGTGAITLADATVAGSGTQTHVASGAITLDAVSCTGNDVAAVFASGVVTLADAVVAGTGTVPATSGIGAITLDGVGIWANNQPAQLVGTVPAVLILAGALPGFLSASGVVPATLSASGTIPAAQSLTGTVPAGLTLTAQVLP
jgi:hypothetical protein